MSIELQKLIVEADAVFDLMLDGCTGDHATFSQWQNGHGEEIGARIESLRLAMKSVAVGSAISCDLYKEAFMEWSRKTDWVQEQFHTFPPNALGKHRADVMREEIERLRAALVQAAVVYPPDGTVSPFTVINLGSGMVKLGDSIHDGRLPALWFGKDGLGRGVEQTLNRKAEDGETLAVVTFANVEGLDILLEVVQRIRSLAFPAAAPRQVSVAVADEIIPDWPFCNPACEYEDPHGGMHDHRSDGCVCEPAKASICRQRTTIEKREGV